MFLQALLLGLSLAVQTRLEVTLFGRASAVAETREIEYFDKAAFIDKLMENKFRKKGSIYRNEDIEFSKILEMLNISQRDFQPTMGQELRHHSMYYKNKNYHCVIEFTGTLTNKLHINSSILIYNK